MVLSARRIRARGIGAQGVRFVGVLGASIHTRVVLVSCASILVSCDGAKTTVDAGPEQDGEVAPVCFAPKVRDPDFSTTTTWSAADEVTFNPGAATFSLA